LCLRHPTTSGRAIRRFTSRSVTRRKSGSAWVNFSLIDSLKRTANPTSNESEHQFGPEASKTACSVNRRFDRDRRCRFAVPSFQPDWLAPVILVPAWCWLFPGLTLALFGCRGNHKRLFVAVMAMWGVFAFLFVEEARSLLRTEAMSTAEWQTVRESGHGLRVVSLNCNVGQTRSAEEVADWQPDIVLLQESPGAEQLNTLTTSLFGDAGDSLHGGDVSILTRGKIRSKFADPESHFVHAEIQLPTSALVDVVSVRLAPPVARIDFWMPGFWIDHRNKRIEHREQISELMRYVQCIPESHHVIVGGDFNAPPTDDALAAFRQRLSDSFLTAGHGWGATGTNEYALFRVDQIWVSDGLQPASVTAHKTQHSDHRMVVCDLKLHQ
jgi:vancomycin resistance protein VanJ